MNTSLTYRILGIIGAAIALIAFFLPWVSISFNDDFLSNDAFNDVGCVSEISLDNQNGYNMATQEGSIEWAKSDFSDNKCVTGQRAESLLSVLLTAVLVLAFTVYMTFVRGRMDEHTSETLAVWYLALSLVTLVLIFWQFFSTHFMTVHGAPRSDIYDITTQYGFWMAVMGLILIAAAGFLLKRQSSQPTLS